MSFSKRILFGAATAALLAGAIALPAQAQYYKGKTITVLVGFSAGGTDTAARIFARHIKQYIPGNPKVIVRNLPGAASLKAQNFLFERAKPDGLTIGFNPFQVMAQLTGAQGIRFDYSKFTFLAGIKGPPFLVVSRADVAPGGVKTAADLLKAKRLNYTGRNAIHSIDVISTASLEVFGLKYNYVPGYRGSASIATSLERSETNITGASLPMYRRQLQRPLKAGTVVPLWYVPRKDVNGNDQPADVYEKLGIKTFKQVYQQTHGKAPSGQVWNAMTLALDLLGTANFIVAGPPNMNKDAAAALRAAFKKAVADENMQKEAVKIVGFNYGYASPEQGAAALAKLGGADPELVKFWTQRATEGRKLLKAKRKASKGKRKGKKK